MYSKKNSEPEVSIQKEIEKRFELDLGKCPYMLTEDLLIWRELLDTYSDMALIHEGQGLRVSFPSLDVSLYIESGEEVYILREILFRKEYNFGLRKKYDDELIFVDIGMNVGIAAIIALKSNRQITKLYGFEPVPYSYDMALKNIRINGFESDMAVLENIGLGKKDCVEKIYFNILRKGCATTNDEYINTFQDKNEELSIQIKPASLELDKINKLHPNSKIILKVDCEGGEYDVFESLIENSHVLDNVEIVIMEWHYYFSKIDHIKQQLEILNFNVFLTAHDNGRTGMLYASR